jgi:hypothetical protein
MAPGRYRGVTYFCRDAGCWVILDTAGSLAPRTSSHLREAETLALFDDARCRGSDLQLRQTAVGLLTLAAGMPKDKLMQAAGRMRQLGRGQTLLVMGLQNITAKISAAAASGSSAPAPGTVTQTKSGDGVAAAAAAAATAGFKTLRPGLLGLIDSNPAQQQPETLKTHNSSSSSSSSKESMCQPDMRGVLSWVLCNTAQGTLSGIPQAASQGMQFFATHGGPPEACVLPERLSVSELYGSSKVVEPVGQLLQGVAQVYVTHARSHSMSKIGREYSINLKDLRDALSKRRPSSQTTTKTYTHLDHRPKSREPDRSQSIWQANESILRTRSLRFY